MLPQNYSNEWIQDTDSFWNEKDSLIYYLNDVKFDLDMVSEGQPTSFELDMISELSEAVSVIESRITELTNQESKQESFEFMGVTQ